MNFGSNALIPAAAGLAVFFDFDLDAMDSSPGRMVLMMKRTMLPKIAW
jgi:hypothetical protein